jgi:hypothetical protein
MRMGREEECPGRTWKFKVIKMLCDCAISMKHSYLVPKIKSMTLSPPKYNYFVLRRTPFFLCVHKATQDHQSRADVGKCTEIFCYLGTYAAGR